MNTRGIKAAGEVVHIRVSPEDIMTAIDIIDKSGMQTMGMSLAMVVKWAMSFAFEATRASGAMPRRDGFEYSEMIKRFLGSRNLSVMAAKQVTSRELIIGEMQAQASDKHVEDLGLMDKAQEFFSGLDVPKHVRLHVPFVHEDVVNVTTRLMTKDVNLNEVDRAKWLLYAPARTAAAHYMSEQDIQQAEQLIRSVWPEYQSVLTP
jgi:hypothetical protein